jgi:hypothetical protein
VQLHGKMYVNLKNEKEKEVTSLTFEVFYIARLVH